MNDVALISFCRVCYFWNDLVAPIWQAWGYGYSDDDGNPLPGFYAWYELTMQYFLRALLVGLTSFLAQSAHDYWRSSRPCEEYMRLSDAALEGAMKRFRARRVREGW